MNIVVGEKETNLRAVQYFSETLFWLPEHRGMYASNFTFEFPFAPPGWLQKLNVGETVTHFDWLSRTIRSWSWAESKVYATNYPDKFWIMRQGKGEVSWAGREGNYDGRFLTLLTVNDGKITHIRDYFDSIAMYRAIGVKLPVFKYGAPAAESMPDREPVPDLSGDEEAVCRQLKDTLSKFVAMDFWEDAEINANDIVHELPFAPDDMPKRYEGKAYDALNAWISGNCLEWKTYPGTILYVTDEEGVFFIESGGTGYMSWTGVKGHYQQRELSFLRTEQGYVKEFHEYFNMTNKFNSINVSIPTFPYLY